MKESVKEKWLEALRSGKFQQTKYKLENDFGANCCLGVLCALAMTEGKVDFDSSDIDNSVRYGGESLMPPKVVYRWAGIKYKTIDKNVIDILVEMNDKGRTFKEIADVIEREL